MPHPQKHSALAEALYEHDADRVTSLAQCGETLGPGETAARLIAEGLSAASLDQFNRQDATDISATLTAARGAGLDLNVPIEGKPAALWLTAHYAQMHAGYAFDMSPIGQSGIAEDTSFKRLKAFATGGVDFSQRDEAGQGFEDVAIASVRAYAERRVPWAAKEDYEPEFDWSEPKLASVQEGLGPAIEDIRRAMKIAQITQIAQDRAHVHRARSLERSPRREPDCPF